jgi:hypothetical protein
VNTATIAATSAATSGRTDGRMDAAAVQRLSGWWRAAVVDSGDAQALSTLCVALSRNAEGESALFLATQAHALSPSSLEALTRLERVTPSTRRIDLCVPYETFLKHTTWHPARTTVRDRLIELLFDSGLACSALPHVDETLTELALHGPSNAEIHAARRACPGELDVDAALDELEADLLAYQGFTAAAAAE